MAERESERKREQLHENSLTTTKIKHLKLLDITMNPVESSRTVRKQNNEDRLNT